MMTSAKVLCVFAIACLTAVSAFSISQPRSQGRKLFGGYRIVPKVCQPTNPSRIKSKEPAICMFNYECSRRKGEVVGACMDGFLFGACCQLPTSLDTITSLETPEDIPNIHEVDHVPDIPILLNPDGTPVGISLDHVTGSTKNNFDSSSSDSGISYTKISTLSPQRTTSSPGKVTQNQQSILSQFETDFPVLLGQQEIIDDLRLPGLITHSNNDIQDHQDHSPVNPVTTLLSPDQILQIADPVDQLPALFAQGLGQNNHSGAETILLNANGTRLDESNNPDELFKPSKGSNKTSSNSNFTQITMKLPPTSPSPTSTVRYSSGNENGQFQTTGTVQYYVNRDKITTVSVSRQPISSQTLNPETNFEKITTTPMSTTSDDDDSDLVRVPTITYDVQSGNKKNDELDREEIAINHIISILNATTPSSGTKLTQQVSDSWGSETKPTVSGSSGTTTEKFPYTFYHPGRPSTYYHYETQSTPFSGSTSYHSTPTTYHSTASYQTPTSHHSTPSFYSTPTPTRGSSQKPASSSVPGGFTPFTTRPTINPPAPTVIVLGPLGTDYTTMTTQKPSTRKPTNGPNRQSLVTKTPSVGTMITHNISTVISTNSVATSNNHVVSTSYISVNLKDKTSPKPVSPVIIHEAVESEVDNESYVVTKKPSTIWTTISSWSSKPSFHPKPSQGDIVFPTSTLRPIDSIFIRETTKPSTSDIVFPTSTLRPADSIYFKETVKPGSPSGTKPTTGATQAANCDDETPAPDDLINFPPVRNPNLTQQEKPTLVESFNDTDFSELDYLNNNDIPTPSFIEDDVLSNKVNTFVSKIVESLQDNFQDLRDVVYAKKNVTTPAPVQTNVITKKPATKKPTPRPSTINRPSSVPTARPVTRKPTKPTTQRPTEKTTTRPRTTTARPRPSSASGVTTKKPTTTPTKRTKPTKKPTSPPTTSTTSEAVLADTEVPVDDVTEVSTEVEEATPDYRRECGVRPLVKRGRIVGGKGATFGEWPWQVLVREATWLGLFTKNKCGGVLITKDYVITAAHCQPGFLATLVAVFGEFDISGELESKRSITRNVRRVIVNRGYNPATFENDLALLELEKSIQFDAHIVPICMPDDDADFTGKTATVTGWGRVKYNGGTPSVLQEVQVPIIQNSVCQDMFRTAGHSKLILDSFLCAGYASGQKDSCEGDSGGPLMMEGPDGKWILVGTVSHGIKCAAPYLPGVYMRTTFFKPWLHSVTGV